MRSKVIEVHRWLLVLSVVVYGRGLWLLGSEIFGKEVWGKVGLYVHWSLHGWHTQGHRSKGIRASYFVGLTVPLYLSRLGLGARCTRCRKGIWVYGIGISIR